jgi:hypothetical protein
MHTTEWSHDDPNWPKRNTDLRPGGERAAPTSPAQSPHELHRTRQLRREATHSRPNYCAQEPTPCSSPIFSVTPI